MEISTLRSIIAVAFILLFNSDIVFATGLHKPCEEAKFYEESSAFVRVPAKTAGCIGNIAGMPIGFIIGIPFGHPELGAVIIGAGFNGVFNVVTGAPFYALEYVPRKVFGFEPSDKTETPQSVSENYQVEVINDQPIYLDEKIIGIRVELKVVLPERLAIKARLIVPGQSQFYQSNDILMRMRACGDVEQSTQCKFMNSLEGGGYSHDYQALDEEDIPTPFWPSTFFNRKVRTLYFELVPAAGQQAREAKKRGIFQVAETLLDGRPHRLPLRLSLNGTNMDNSLATLAAETLHEYNLKEMYLNSGREKVLEELLTPILLDETKK